MIDLEVAKAIVGDVWNISPDKFMTGGKSYQFAWPRWCVAKLLRDVGEVSCAEISRLFGCHHGTIVYGCDAIDNWERYDIERWLKWKSCLGVATESAGALSKDGVIASRRSIRLEVIEDLIKSMDRALSSVKTILAQVKEEA